jgi:HD superfamily phosphohydrolase
MTGKIKIFNDPVYGFISFPKPSILLDVIDHPYFQRLRRISQTALTYYVYPGAHHTRFHHALGAYHLMTQAIEVLRQKGVAITHEEAEGVCLAILLHDIGHGPFSHALEHTIIDIHHEDLSILFMKELNEYFGGKLSLAIDIFEDKYHKRFLHQLISGQLDMDRMDYLNRDSFYTGVSEGVIGYDRITKMLNVYNGELVVEEKGIYSIEKFLIARRLMYWQVYLHKTVLAAEQMLIKVFKRAKELVTEGVILDAAIPLKYFLDRPFHEKKDLDAKELTKHFAMLDDFDIIASLKNWIFNKDYILSFLSKSLIERRLFKLELQNAPFNNNTIENIRQKITLQLNNPSVNLDYLIFTGEENNQTYNARKDEIKILFKNGEVRSITDSMDYELHTKIIKKYYLCYPKNFN